MVSEKGNPKYSFNTQTFQIMTTGKAGGLTQPYKGMMPAALEAL